MTSAPQETPFDRFARRHAGSFRRIAARTSGEQLPEDVRNEAWLLAMALGEDGGGSFDLDAPGADDRLLARLFQKLVRYTELNIRHAVRLDHAPASGDEGDVHPLLHKLASGELDDPLQSAMHRQSALDEEDILTASGSLAVAFVRLLRRFDNRMQAVADHLLISKSWAYRRCARARVLAVHQQAVPAPMMADDFLPGPWRRFQVWRPMVGAQLEFEFDEGLAL